MSVSEQEIEQAAKAIAGVYGFDWDALAVNDHIAFDRNEALELARAVLPILRPEGTRLVGTCKGCHWAESWIDRMFTTQAVERLMCANKESPCGAKRVSPDFGCVLYQKASGE